MSSICKDTWEEEEEKKEDGDEEQKWEEAVVSRKIYSRV